ncbi:MAG: hypothetical protein Q4B52_05580 [Tissierellia bacterium]|nr:hypothetical protein [Tissierellia bacterium]
MKEFKLKIIDILKALSISIVAFSICNVLIGEFNIADSIISMIILSIICVIGYFLSFIVPLKKISPVLWISIIAILIASPISPISRIVIGYVDKLSINAIVTVILAYTGVIIGKDWNKFKAVGIKGVVVSIFVIIGTFLISSLMGDFFMKVF